MTSLIELGGKFLRTLRTIYGVVMGNASIDAEEGDEQKLGRRTISDARLGSNRDAILNMLCPWWPDVGWQLVTATTRVELRQALQPATVHGNKQYVDRLLRATDVTSDAPQVRKRRIALGNAVKAMHDAQAKRNKCMEQCREIEFAWSQATPDQVEFVKREFPTRRAACQDAQDQAFTAETKERALENELLDMEAAYSQDELLMFITKAKYALNPLNLANAMAGLPNAIDVPFLGAWQSHARCSKLDCSEPYSFHYELFETIQSIWERSKSSSSPLFEFFALEVKALPKTVVTTHPTMGTNRVDNYVRAKLCENWWYLQRAIERSLQAKDDPRPMHFIIASNFDKIIAEPRTYLDSALAKAASICD
jgi:hypothetical protein